ncbi:unnamed protein product [Adineta steineri]|uniref:SEP domain-containing protein n=1 Tax=Adineta steineri TaxID=433720 RepID=A0A815ARQ5_9BILA|nr:unnamed protein product [Adineta steineri]
MSSNDRDEILNRFISVTQCSYDQAREYLENAEWDEQVAMNFFFESGASNYREPSPPPITRTYPKDNYQNLPDAATFSRTNDYESDDDLLQAAIEDSLRIKPPETTPSVFPKRTNEYKSIISSKINTVNNFKHDRDDSDDEGQAFYAGGSERSGQQIIGPPKSRNNDKKITNVFEAARKQGATEAHDDKSTSASSSSQTTKEKPFTSAGYSLGDEHVSSRTQGRSSSEATAAAAVSKVEQLPIRLYSNGFTVGDGELRKFEENKEFLEYIKRGEVPPELRKLNTNGKQIEVRLEDHRGEEYKRVAPSFKPFHGTGHTLGLSGSDRAAFKSSTASPVSVVPETIDTRRLEQLATKQLKTSSSSTTIRLRLPDISTPICIQIDLNRTLADVRQFLTENIPSLQSNKFEFMEPPSTKINRDNEKRKISDAKLLNSTLAVRRIA